MSSTSRRERPHPATAAVRRLAGHRPSGRVLAVLAVVGTNVLWGTTIVASRPVLERVPPLTLAWLRAAVAVAVLMPLLARSGARPAWGRGPALLGVCLAGFYACFNLGIRHARAADAALIVEGGVPLATALLALLILGERVTGTRLIAMLGSAIGVAAIAIEGGASRPGASVLGSLLLCGCAFFLATYTVLGRRVFPRDGLLPAVAGALAYGTLALVPAVVGELATTAVARPTGADAARIFYLGGGGVALAYVLFGYGLRHLEAGVVGICSTVAPLVGVAAAAFVRHETVTPVQLACGLLIVGAVWRAARSDERERKTVAR
jgi:drug/metabolite transporter (DMT)-like permease